ncbi:MAG: CCA tRNA nucleotidyltransferase [Anaerolineaceae bacterium]|jgi:tRNA nucleotidyltransferase (CCA-adding enzyme)|nr:MAG: CCA tRNA nucleotidyltransferase [Anaerolineaceae bacterium]
MTQPDMLRLLRDPNLIPPEKQNLLSDLAAQAASLGFSCYLVGGFVRDLLLRRPVKDLDFVVEGDAIKLGRMLVKKFGGKLTPHKKFHTAVWRLPSTFNLHPSFLDLITARKETYAYPGALPTVTPSTIENDLRRRDFTINALAVRLDGDRFGELLDPLNGQGDLEEGIVRVLHPRSFIDDPTRILRALRYEGRYSFDLDSLTSDLINSEALAILSQLSGERLRHELDLIFEEDQFARILLRAGKFGLLKSIHPKMPEFNQDYAGFLEMDNRLDVSADRRVMGYMLWFMNLSEEDVFSISSRLGFTNELTLSVWAAAQLKRSLPHLAGSKPSVWTYALEKLPLLSIYAVYLVSRENALLDYISMWRHVKPHTTGNDLLKRKLTPGPRFGDILSRLRAAWLDGEVQSLAQEKKLLERLLEERGAT